MSQISTELEPISNYRALAHHEATASTGSILMSLKEISVLPLGDETETCFVHLEGNKLIMCD